MKTLLKCLAAVLLLTSTLAAKENGSSVASPHPWNVVLILVDDYGWTDLGCFGSELYETPNIDKLAREGMKFTQSYSACTVCSPTRAAIMTGKYPARLHVTDWITGLPPENPPGPPAPPSVPSRYQTGVFKLFDRISLEASNSTTSCKRTAT